MWIIPFIKIIDKKSLDYTKEGNAYEKETYDHHFYRPYPLYNPYIY